MTRAELINILAELVLRQVINEDDARALLAQFDRGEWVDIPLPIAEAVTPVTTRDGMTAWVVLLTSLGAAIGAQVAAQIPTSTARILTEAQGRNLRDRLRAEFDAEMRRLAGRAAGGASVGTWQADMTNTVRRYMLAQASAGVGRPLTQPEIQALSLNVQAQAQYLYRYAADIAARRQTGNPLSLPYLQNRSTQYGGAGWGLYFQAQESQAAYNEGWVVDYISRDDDRTCGPCLDAERNGPYLPGLGPMPGDVCLGHGYCRCERRLRYDPAAWGRLAGAVTVTGTLRDRGVRA